MMFAGKLHGVQAALLAGLLLLALAIVGLFHLAAAAITLLHRVVDAPAADAIVGAAAIAPLLLAIAVNGLFGGRRKHALKGEASAFMDSPDLPGHVRDLIETVQNLTRSAPVAAVALAVVAGFMLMRHPSSLPLVISAFAAQQHART